MTRTKRNGTETVATVNGWNIVRSRRGAAVFWYARAIDADDYMIAQVHVGTKGEAIAYASRNSVPAPAPVSEELAALRAKTEATMARFRARVA